MNTAYRICSDTWGEDTASVCTSGSLALAQSFMTSSVKAVGKPDWRFRFLDTPHLLKDVARNPAELGLLRAVLSGVELRAVLRNRECSICVACLRVSVRPFRLTALPCPYSGWYGGCGASSRRDQPT